MAASTTAAFIPLYGFLLVVVPTVLAVAALVVGYAGLRFLLREIAAPADEQDRGPSAPGAG